MSVSVYIPDAEMQRFFEKLKKAENKVKTKAYHELYKTAVEIDKNAKGYCPVDTGRLRSSIHHRVLTRDAMNRATNHVIETSVIYAPFVEKGTSRQRAQPYMRPAYLLGVNRFYARMRNLIS